MKKRRHSRQRELILERLRSTTQHPTAGTLYEWLKPDYPSLSLGTVYRNLNLLANEGTIRRISFPVERFDANIRPHAHFLCAVCGRVYDLDLPYDESLDRRAEAAGGHKIGEHELLFTGTCSVCMR